MKVEKGKKVKMEYELRTEGGFLIETSAQRGPIEYVQGEGKMLSGLESRIEGMSAGEERDGLIPAAEAYGTDETLPLLQVPREHFPEGEEIKIGRPFEAKDASGNTVRFKVVKVEEGQVVVQLAHPLSGKDIRFKVKILEVS
jgi:FKBP-type peptidyl-prolyl cis-trans isomerase 2